MSKVYKPNTPFTVAAKLLVPQVRNVQGKRVKEYPEPDTVEAINFCSFRTFGGTERERDGVYTIEDTAQVETWYTPTITSDCRWYICQTGRTYEILGTPENVNMRNQWLTFKVRAVGGKA